MSPACMQPACGPRCSRTESGAVSSVFRKTRHGPAVRLAAGEVRLLADLFEQLLVLLDDGESSEDSDPLVALTGLDDAATPPVKPTDPALARLLPDAYADDPGSSAEFRRFTESDLRTQKQAAIRVVLDSLPPDGGRLPPGENTRYCVACRQFDDLRTPVNKKGT